MPLGEDDVPDDDNISASHEGAGRREVLDWMRRRARRLQQSPKPEDRVASWDLFLAVGSFERGEQP